jgi:hypothetical protein
MTLNEHNDCKPIKHGNVTGWMINSYTLGLRITSPTISMDDIRNSETIGTELVPEIPFHCLVEFAGARNVEAEARRYPPGVNMRRIALVYKSPVGRMLGNGYLRLVPATLPTRLFKNEKKALVWLENAGTPVA